MANRTFNIEVTMNERWVNDFCSMLHWMYTCGHLGYSSVVSFYSDGDGDFHPEFNIDTDYHINVGIDGEKYNVATEVIFDAG